MRSRSEARFVRTLAVLSLLATGLVACADSSSAGLPGDPVILGPQMGGQTGSLECGQVQVPSSGHFYGDHRASIVLFVGRCEGELPDLSELLVLDESGNPVAYDVQEVDEDTVQLEAPFASLGTYTVVLNEAERREVQVASRLPARLGQVQWLSGPSCMPSFELVPDPALIPLKARLQLLVSVDGGPARVWYARDQLDLRSEGVELTLDPCSSEYGCIPDGSHRLRIEGVLAGSDVQLEPVTMSFEVRCDAAPENGSCSSHNAPVGHAWPALLSLALLATRRRRPMPR